MEKALSLAGKAGARVVSKVLEQMFISLMAPFDAKHLQIMVDHGWHVIESIRWSTTHEPEYPPELDAEEVKRLERMHGRLIKAALAALGFTRTVISRFPKALVEQYVSREYAMKWFRRHRSDIIQILETKKGSDWLESEVKEVKAFLWGGSR
jgi:hypothetical protein